MRTIESHLRNIMNETVDHALNRMGMPNYIDMITEMPIPLKDYKRRVEGLKFQLVENWCLCKWCQLFNPKCENFNHWITELKTCINNLKLVDIKNGINKKRTLKRMLIDNFDYDDTNMIVRVIHDKFDTENINDNFQITKVTSAFADNIEELIDAISVNDISTKEYIYKDNFQ